MKLIESLPLEHQGKDSVVRFKKLIGASFEERGKNMMSKYPMEPQPSFQLQSLFPGMMFDQSS